MKEQTVLIIDDDSMTRRALSRLLAGLGYHSVTADPGDVLSAVAERMPFAILIDVHLTGVSGYDVLDTLVEENVSAPILMISGAAAAHEVVRAIRVGAEDFLQKPITMNMLGKALGRLRPVPRVEGGSLSPNGAA